MMITIKEFLFRSSKLFRVLDMWPNAVESQPLDAFELRLYSSREGCWTIETRSLPTTLDQSVGWVRYSDAPLFPFVVVPIVKGWLRKELIKAECTIEVNRDVTVITKGERCVDRYDYKGMSGENAALIEVAESIFLKKDGWE